MDQSELRMTTQRRAILSELKADKSHPTAHALYTRLRRRLPRISLGTVYRNLETLRQYGLVQVLDRAGAEKRFDADTDTHYHVRCLRCGRVDDVPPESVTNLNRAIRISTDYDIIEHRIEFIGVCPRCRKKPARKRGAAGAASDVG